MQKKQEKTVARPRASQLKTAKKRSRGAMLVKEIMVDDVRSCGPDTSAATAMGMMWEQDCGVLPVVDSERRVVGMVTDRDLATAMATRNRLASEIAVQDVLNGPPCFCSPDDDVKRALMTMASHKIRRLPVVASDGSLHGILSINDAISQAGPRSAALSYNDVMDTLKSVCEHRTMAGA